MISPASGSTLSGAAVTFTWSAGSGATAYYLYVGAGQGLGDIYSQNVALATSQSVTGIPTNGSTIYVRLWTLFGSNWQFNDYTYTASGGNAKAVLQTPSPGSTLGGAAVTFTWDAGSGATAYYLYVGTSQGLGDIYSQNAALATSQSVTAIPADGSKIYVRLWTLFGSTWQFNDYAYTASGGNTKAVLQAPVSGSTLSGSSVTFKWSAVSGAAAYWLDIGTAVGGFDLYSQGQATATSQTVTGLPVDGSSVHLRLWTAANGVWQYNDYSFTAANAIKASMLTPAPGSTLSGASAAFKWSAVSGAAAYWLDIGTAAGGFDLYSQGQATATSQTVTGLPINGSTIFVRLWTAANGVWQYNDYIYTAKGSTVSTLSKASMVTPTPGSTLSGAAVSFTWDAGSGAAAYWIDVGTVAGAFDIYSQGEGLATSQTVNSLPTDGSTIYVRLWTALGGVWQYSDYTYTASGSSAPSLSRASMLAPPPGSRLGGAAATFTWRAGSTGSSYELDFSQSVGGRELGVGSPGSATSWVAQSLPTDGSIVRVRLWTMFADGSSVFSDYTYMASSAVQPPKLNTGTSGPTGGITLTVPPRATLTAPPRISLTVPPLVSRVASPGGGGGGAGGGGAGSGGAGSAGANSSGCNCSDIPSLRHRLEEVTALRAGLQAKLQTRSANEMATQDGWFALLNELRGTLPQLSYTYPATPMNISMFNGYVDPLCGGRGTAADSCFEGATAAHQVAHDASCRVGHWNGQGTWTAREMIQEEIAGNQAETNYLQSAIAAIACTCRTPFVLLVQNGTVSNISMPGAITGGSSRSLNGGQGIVVPITLHDDGTFEGSNSGTDSGTAAGFGAGGSVHSQFGQAISIQANGVIAPGQCNGPSCAPDVMHLVLSGVTGPQSTQAQARFPAYSRDIHEVTRGGSGALRFDIPAYIGQSVQQTLLDMGMLKSTIAVGIVAADGAAQQGAAVLPAPQCRLAQSVPPPQVGAGGGGGGAGGGGGSGGSGGGSSGGGGSTGSGPNSLPQISVQVQETVHVGDSVAPPGVIAPVPVAANEGVHVTDTVPFLPGIVISVSESIHVTDTQTTLGPGVQAPPPPLQPKK